jgi:hypothetical protein
MYYLDECWRIRNAAATSLALSEQQMRRAIEEATIDELVGLIETFAPGRSTGPEWTRSFDALVERLHAWRDSETLAALAESFRARGMPWIAVTNALSAEQAAGVRAERLPGFTS